MIIDKMGVVINGLRENEDWHKQRKHLRKMVKKLQVNKDHFVMSLLTTLKSNLGDGYTPEVKEAWMIVFKMLLRNGGSSSASIDEEEDPERTLDYIKMTAFLFLTIIAAYVYLNTNWENAKTFDEMVFIL